MKKLFQIILFSLLSFTATSVFAVWDGILSGKLHSIDVTQGQNYGFRIVLSGFPKLCGNNNTWAYLNETDSNYQTYVSVLLAAKLSDKVVTIYTNKEINSGNEYCHIGYIVLK